MPLGEFSDLCVDDLEVWVDFFGVVLKLGSRERPEPLVEFADLLVDVVHWLLKHRFDLAAPVLLSPSKVHRSLHSEVPDHLVHLLLKLFDCVRQIVIRELFLWLGDFHLKTCDFALLGNDLLDGRIKLFRV